MDETTRLEIISAVAPPNSQGSDWTQRADITPGLTVINSVNGLVGAYRHDSDVVRADLPACEAPHRSGPEVYRLSGASESFERQFRADFDWKSRLILSPCKLQSPDRDINHAYGRWNASPAPNNSCSGRTGPTGHTSVTWSLHRRRWHVGRCQTLTSQPEDVVGGVGE